MLARPKMLVGIELLASKQLRFQVGQTIDYDTNVDITIPAGIYYLGWDAQSDDLLWKIMSLAYTAYDALASAGALVSYNTSSPVGKPFFGIDTAGRVTVAAGEPQRIAWDALDGPELAGYLGFAAAVSTDLTNGITGAYQSGYAFYCDEDGQLQEHLVEDIDIAIGPQRKALAGGVRTQHLGHQYANVLHLNHLAKVRTFSAEKGYGETPTYPYERNAPLQCFWRAACEGRPFRVYTHGRIDVAQADLAQRAEYAGAGTAASTITTLTDTAKSYDIEPFELVGKLIALPSFFVTDMPAGFTTQRFHVDSHNATVLTVANSLHNQQFDGLQYFVLPQRYRTYVLDINQMSRFEPVRVGQIERYGLQIPLLRYVA